ncbi:g2855 [Coccomyxa elongata]
MMDRKTPAVPVPTPNAKTKISRGSHTASGKLLKDQLDLVKYQVDGRTRYTIKPIEDKLSFDKGFYVFIRAVQALTNHNQDVVVVGLAGPSGSGKTAFSEKVQAFMPGCSVLSLDNYNDASRLIDGNFDDPRLTDYELLLQNIADLKNGKDVQAPIYNFKTSSREGYRTVKVPESHVVIVEGIYALSEKIRPLLDLRVSVTGGVHFDLVKRVLRDIKRSGQAPEEIIQQITDTVYPMYKAFIEPDLNTAHLKIYNTFNPFSGFMAPTYILKSAKTVTPEAIKAVLKANHTSRKDSDTYDIYLLPPGEDVETCTSWLRMRNRDGRYNLMFEEWVTDGPFIISPRITFEVSVRILGGLMALGYEIGTMLKRSSQVWADDTVTVKLDDIEGMDRQYVQIQGKDRAAVADVGRRLGLEDTYIARSYIEQLQLEKLTASFQCVTEDLRRQFMVDGEPLLHENSIGSSPILASSFRRTTGFNIPDRNQLSSSAPHGNGVHAGKAGRNGKQSGSCNSSGLLSHHMRGAAEANGNGYSSRHSSELSMDDEWEPRPPSSSAIGKVEKMVARLTDRVEELAVRPEDGTATLSAHVLDLTTQQQALSAQVQVLAKAVASLDRRMTNADEASSFYWGASAAVAFVATGALATLALLSVVGRR